ncbi:MAG TPA: isocitrate lyase/phosphoenolpyruvate mutase family protein [Egicoccus sp.]|nr:isocitrate lyase/phosphoenolpyruvate mutase family protein [Egicoccus sp.]HSK24292.1 isocitrate lyase/phosphoenolpyruvate mutase family protein [Egicoccus sp.]
MAKGQEIEARRATFARLHESGLFVMPNAWDAGSAKLLAWAGAPAVATTSSGHAASLGRVDQEVGREELFDHVAALVAAVDVPLSVDAERCFADDAQGVADTVAALADLGAAGVSIEDYDPGTGAIDRLEVAVERVAAAADAARGHGVVLTARAENHLYGVDDLDDTIRRLRAYHGAGAAVVYAPGIRRAEAIRRMCDEIGAPVNALLMPAMPSVPELAALGVRRVSTGGALAFAAYGAMVEAARELLGPGTAGYLAGSLDEASRRAAFLPPV